MVPPFDTVLLVVRDADLVKTLQAALQLERMPSRAVASAELAMEALAAERCAVVILDGEADSGGSLIPLLRAEPRCAHVPVVVVMSAAAAPLRQELADGVSVLSTPIDPLVFGRLVRLLTIASRPPDE